MVNDSCSILTHQHLYAFLTKDDMLGENLLNGNVLLCWGDCEIVILEFLNILFWLLTNISYLLHFFLKLRCPLFLLPLYLLLISLLLQGLEKRRLFRYRCFLTNVGLGLTWETYTLAENLLVAFPKHSLFPCFYVLLVLFTPSLNTVQ